ncbi:MAG: GGDEF domain-containing protein [Sandaracinaceae bacterium]|nr:GGDEF domain-containing protein [Sandaracinaceae bacterium]
MHEVPTATELPAPGYAGRPGLATRLSDAGMLGAQARVQRRWPTAVLVVLVLAAIAIVDHVVEASLLSHLYCIPIVLAAVRLGMREGVAAALAATLLAEWAPTAHAAGFSGLAIHLVLYLAVALVSARAADCAAAMHRLAITDDLTGLHNLRSFEARATPAIERAAKMGLPIAMLSLDVDRLKRLNDAYGHLTGADAVRTVGRLLAAIVPAEASACRYGGDEFVVLLPGVDQRGALELAERLQAGLARLSPVLAGKRFSEGTLSVSVGVAAREDASEPALPETLFREADHALYAAKAAGRGRAASYRDQDAIRAGVGEEET